MKRINGGKLKKEGRRADNESCNWWIQTARVWEEAYRLVRGVPQGAGGPPGGKLTLCCGFPDGRASTYQKRLSIRRGICKKEGWWIETVYCICNRCLCYLNTLLFSVPDPTLSVLCTHFKSIAPHSLPASATSKGCPIYIVARGVKHFRAHAQADTLVRWKRLSFHTLHVFRLFPAKPWNGILCYAKLSVCVWVCYRVCILMWAHSPVFSHPKPCENV